VIGQWAKYVRPGYQRVDATLSPTANVFLSAFKGGNKVMGYGHFKIKNKLFEYRTN
jgi:O-glycosyl hydrolase